MTADDEPLSRARHKRTRTGCMKCRTRRRKCDEGKPRCQRCVDGGFECQYGPRLTFLDKNVLTVSRGAPAPASASAQAATNTTSSSTADGGKPKYVRLQFVEPGAATAPAAATQPTSTTAATDAESHETIISPGSSETLAVSFYEPPPHEQKPASDMQRPLTDNVMPFQVQPWSPPAAPQMPQTPGIINPAALKPPANTSPKDPAYETALNVLLSLGNDMPTPNFASPATAHTPAALNPSPMSSAAVSADYNLTQDRLLQLLRYYRYQVASWLDICDMGQTFGLAVARLAVESEGALSGLLALTSRAQQADGHADVDDAEYLGALAEGSLLRQQGVDIYSDQYLAQVALVSTCRFVSSIPASWQSPTAALFGEHFLAGALEHAGTKLRASILIMLLRLELSAALINGSTVSVPDQVAYIHTTQSPAGSNIDESMFRYATEALLLCGRAANFCAAPFAAPPQASDAAPTTPVQRWTLLSDALAAWYAGRPHEFRPMAEMEGEESLFPVILFTNGAAVFANQLYHAAMLLLLQSKPRTLQAGPGGARKSSAASQLWHAQRVCGICLNNDRRDSWDPCLVASLHLAAQRLTYEPQQRAILDCLARVKVVTGWNLGAFASELQEAWGMAGG